MVMNSPPHRISGPPAWSASVSDTSTSRAGWRRRSARAPAPMSGSCIWSVRTKAIGRLRNSSVDFRSAIAGSLLTLLVGAEAIQRLFIGDALPFRRTPAFDAFSQPILYAGISGAPQDFDNCQGRAKTITRVRKPVDGALLRRVRYKLF